MANSPKYEALQSKFDTIASAIVHNVQEVASKALSVNLISLSNLDDAVNDKNSARIRSIALLSQILRKVESNESNFDVVMDILRQTTVTRDLADRIDERVNPKPLPMCSGLSTRELTKSQNKNPSKTICEKSVVPKQNLLSLCPCGECSIKKYLGNDCPKTSKDRYPYLDLAKGSKTDLMARLDSELDKICMHFGTLVTSTCQSLESQNVSSHIVSTCVLSIASSDSVAVHKPLTERQEELLIKATSISEKFIVLRQNWSFFNYEILKHIINNCGSDQDKKNLQEYLREFEIFCKRSTFEVPPHVYGQVQGDLKNRKILAIKLTNNLDNVLQSVQNAKRKIAEILGIPLSCLFLCRVDEGCVQLVFLIPSSIAENVFALNYETSISLLENGIKVISIANIFDPERTSTVTVNEGSLAQELCHRVVALKETPQLTEIVQERLEPAGNTSEREEELRQQVQDKDDIIKRKDVEICMIGQENDWQIQNLQQIIEIKDNQLQEKDQIIQDIIRDNEQTIAASEQECQRLKGTISDQQRKLQEIEQELEFSKQMMAQFQTRIKELEQELQRKSPTEDIAPPSLRDAPQTHQSDTSKTVSVNTDCFTLIWMDAKEAAPQKMFRVPNAVVDGEIVYFSSGAQIIAYNLSNESWEQLPDCPYSYCSLAVIRNSVTTSNSLTAIGGEDSRGEKTNRLYTLTGEGRSNRWNKAFSSMPTRRSHTIAVSTNQDLIVAGGIDQILKLPKTIKTIKTITKIVEIKNIDTQQWSSAANLPEPLYMGSGTICHKCLYIGGGTNESEATKSVYTCTLADLLLTCRSKSFGERLFTQSLSLMDISPSKSNVWSCAADLPCSNSTFVTIYDQLLAVGGGDHKDSDTTSDIYQYWPTSNTWEVIKQMNIRRSLCFAAVLPTNELMVVGGCTPDSWDSGIDSVEKAITIMESTEQS